MSNPARSSDLEVAEDIVFIRRTWKAQRAGWVVLALVILGAVSGLFGAGPASRATVEGAGFAVEYERFARRLAPTELRIRLGAAPGGGDARVAIANRFLDEVEMRRVTPPPLRAERGPDRTVYVFAGNPDTIVFAFRHARGGRAEGDVAVSGAEALAFATLVHF